MTVKNILKNRLVRGVVTLIFSLVLRTIFVTARVHTHLPKNTEPFMSGEAQGIFCFWHGNMIMHPFQKPKGRKMSVLISHHRDGALITSVLGWLGIGTVRGSSRKGGASAMRELFSACEAGTNIAITPDGPRGPLHHVAGGAKMLAQVTGLPLIPVAYGASRGKEFSSWDKFFLPYLFARIAFVAGEPIYVSGNEADTVINTQIHAALMQCMQRAQSASQSASA